MFKTYWLRLQYLWHRLRGSRSIANPSQPNLSLVVDNVVQFMQPPKPELFDVEVLFKLRDGSTTGVVSKGCDSDDADRKLATWSADTGEHNYLGQWVSYKRSPIVHNSVIVIDYSDGTQRCIDCADIVSGHTTRTPHRQPLLQNISNT